MRELERSLVPHGLTPAGDPPAVTSRPWTTFTVAFTSEDKDFSYEVSLSNVLDALRASFGLSGQTSAFLLKLDWIKVWASAATSGDGPAASFTLRSAFYNPDETDGYALAVMTDTGTVTVPARVGFSYGKINGTRVISLSSAAKLATVSVSAVPLATTGSIQRTIHVHGSFQYATSE